MAASKIVTGIYYEVQFSWGADNYQLHVGLLVCITIYLEPSALYEESSFSRCYFTLIEKLFVRCVLLKLSLIQKALVN